MSSTSREICTILAVVWTVFLLLTSYIWIMATKVHQPSVRERETDYPEPYSYSCPCDTPLRKSKHISSTSRCGDRATERGAHQKVISYSFFGPIHNDRGELNWYAKVSSLNEVRQFLVKSQKDSSMYSFVFLIK